MSLSKYLQEATRSFYIAKNRVNFTHGEEHAFVDITKASPQDIAGDIISPIMLCWAMCELSKKLGREPSYEELGEWADDNARDFAAKVESAALHMSVGDHARRAKVLFPGLQAKPPTE
jgi:hypothetical protein